MEIRMPTEYAGRNHWLCFIIFPEISGHRDLLVLLQNTDNLLPTPAKPDAQPKTPPPTRPVPPKVAVDGKTVTHKDEPTVEGLQAEIKELRMLLEMLQTRQEWVLFICLQHKHIIQINIVTSEKEILIF